MNSSTDTSTAGYFQLNWQSSRGEGDLVLQESVSENFTDAKILYRGPDLATVISGKADNVYYYRISDPQDPNSQSNTVTVTVAHHSLRNAFSFFGVGAIVFIATLLLILRGNRQGH